MPSRDRAAASVLEGEIQAKDPDQTLLDAATLAA